MSAFKGTPGPWFAGEQSDISGWVEIRVPGYSRNPVACATPADAGDAEARRDAETLANARLIAAAPELLSCLDMTAHGLEVASRVVGGELGAVFSDRAMSARDAIAKATGGDA